MNTYAIKQKTPQLNTRYVSKQQLSNVYTKIVSNIDSTSSALSTAVSLISSNLDERIETTNTTLETVSGLLDGRITNTNDTLESVAGTLNEKISTTNSTLESVSGILNEKITDTNITLETTSSLLDGKISNTNTALEASSGILDNKITATNTSLETASGLLDGRITNTNNTLESVSGTLNEKISTANSNIQLISSNLSSTTDNKFGETISAFCRFFTGTGDTNTPSEFVNKYLPTIESSDLNVYYSPKTYGYAYLDVTKKVAAELMPDISIIDINVVDVKQLYELLQLNGYLTHDNTFADGTDSFYKRIKANPSDRETIVTIIKECLEAYIIKNTNIKIYGQGDVLVVTFYNFDQISNFDNEFKDVFSQEYIAGAWMCNAETRENNKNTSVKFVKISFNQGSILSINNILPTSTGNVYLPLSSIYRVSGSKNIIGKDLATNLQKIKDTIVDTAAMENVPTVGGLVDFLNVTDRFVFDNSIDSCYAYATINEFMNLNIATETIREALSGAIDTKVDKVTGKSLIDDTEITRLASVHNYDDTEVRSLINNSANKRLVATQIQNQTLVANTTYKLGTIEILNITTIPDSDEEIILKFTTSLGFDPSSDISFPSDLLWINYTSVSFNPNKTYLVKIRNYVAESYELTTIN